MAGAEHRTGKNGGPLRFHERTGQRAGEFRELSVPIRIPETALRTIVAQILRELVDNGEKYIYSETSDSVLDSQAACTAVKAGELDVIIRKELSLHSIELSQPVRAMIAELVSDTVDFFELLQDVEALTVLASLDPNSLALLERVLETRAITFNPALSLHAATQNSAK